MKASDVLLVFCTCSSEEAKALAQRLVEQRLVACVNMVPAVQSIYQWQGKIEQASETLLIMKTTRSSYAALEASIRQQHSYELPEILAVPVAHGLPAYLAWVGQLDVPN